MARKTCYDLVHKLQSKFTLSGRYTTNIYMSEIPLLDQFSYLLLTEQFTGIIPVGHQTFVSALKIPAMKISKNLFIPFSICPANREFHILSTI